MWACQALQAFRGTITYVGGWCAVYLYGGLEHIDTYVSWRCAHVRVHVLQTPIEKHRAPSSHVRNCASGCLQKLARPGTHTLGMSDDVYI